MGKTSPGEPSGSVPPGSASPPALGPLPPAVRCQQRITSGLGRAPRALPGEASLRLEDCGADSSRSWKAASFQAPRLLPASPPPRVTPLGTGWPWPVALSEEVSPFFFLKPLLWPSPACIHPILSPSCSHDWQLSHVLRDYLSNLFLGRNSPNTPRGAPPARTCPCKEGQLLRKGIVPQLELL